jgi:transcriptional regulator with XRE-family HTH domain
MSRAARERLLGEYRASGLTQEQFAARSGIKVGTLRTWIYKRRTPAVADRGRFAPVRIVDEARSASASRGSVTVRWPQGIEVRIAMDLDRAGVASLVRKLLGPCLR